MTKRANNLSTIGWNNPLPSFLAINKEWHYLAGTMELGDNATKVGVPPISWPLTQNVVIHHVLFGCSEHVDFPWHTFELGMELLRDSFGCKGET